MWKIQLTIAINFISGDQEGDKKSDSIEIMINKKGGEVIEDLFQPLLSRYKIVLETFVKDSDFIFD